MGVKYIQREPPTYNGDPSAAAQDIIDYLEYLRENLNFILNTYAQRLAAADNVAGNEYATPYPNIITEPPE